MLKTRRIAYATPGTGLFCHLELRKCYSRNGVDFSQMAALSCHWLKPEDQCCCELLLLGAVNITFVLQMMPGLFYVTPLWVRVLVCCSFKKTATNHFGLSSKVFMQTSCETLRHLVLMIASVWKCHFKHLERNKLVSELCLDYREMLFPCFWVYTVAFWQDSSRITKLNI